MAPVTGAAIAAPPAGADNSRTRRGSGNYHGDAIPVGAVSAVRAEHDSGAARGEPDLLGMRAGGIRARGAGGGEKRVPARLRLGWGRLQGGSRVHVQGGLEGGAGDAVLPEVPLRHAARDSLSALL